MKLIGYVRISNKDKQDPASQIKLMQDIGITSDNILLDMGSGAIPPLSRPSFKKLSDMVNAGEVSEIVFSEYSRIGRDILDSMAEVMKLMQARVKIRSLSETERLINDFPIDTQVVLISIAMMAAQRERQHISERTKWGMDNAKTKGTKSGKPIGRPVIEIDFNKVNDLMSKCNLKEAQAIRVLGIKPSTYYAAKKKNGGV